MVVYLIRHSSSCFIKAGVHSSICTHATSDFVTVDKANHNRKDEIIPKQRSRSRFLHVPSPCNTHKNPQHHPPHKPTSHLAPVPAAALIYRMSKVKNLQDLLIHLGHFLDRLHSSWQRFQFKEEVLGLPDTDGFFLEMKNKKDQTTQLINVNW